MGLQTERDVLLEEMEKLRKSLERPEDEGELVRPATGVLSLEADQLRAQLAEMKGRGEQEQGILERESEELRRQIKDYQEKLQRVLAEKEVCQRELQDLKQSRDGAKALERELHEQQEHQNSLTGAIGRSRSMIEAYDKKIEE